MILTLLGFVAIVNIIMAVKDLAL